MALPLAGVRVLDLGSRIAAPFCAGLLGEQGADVIKIEQPHHGEYLRSVGPFAGSESLMWAVEGRSRRSVTLDLRRSEGQQLLRRLAAHVDVLCENFRPGTMERWGLAPDDLGPRLVYVRVSAYGQSGPRAGEPGVDLLGNALGGLLGLTGPPERPPVKSAVTLSDHLSGVLAALAASAALFRRERTGTGAVIDASLYGSILRTVEVPVARFTSDGTVTERAGNSSPVVEMSGVYETSDGRYVAVVAAATLHVADLAGLLSGATPAQWVAVRTAANAVAELIDAGVPASIVHEPADLLGAAAGLTSRFVSVDIEGIGPHPQQPVHPHFVGEEPVVLAAPALGSSNRDVWCDLVGLSHQELHDLAEQGVI